MNRVNAILCALGGYVVCLLGGLDEQLTALIVLMCLDFISGLLCAFTGRSSKSPSGYLSSKAAGAGIVKKIAYLICVVVAVILERATGLQYIRQIVIISFVVTETLSVLENCKNLGIKVPDVIYKALDAVKDKEAPPEADGSAPDEDVKKL